MKESKLQTKIQSYLKSLGYVVFKTLSSNRNGISDIIACSNEGRFVAIEVKAPGKLNNTSALQDHFIDSINNNNGVAFAADSMEIVTTKLGKENK